MLSAIESRDIDDGVTFIAQRVDDPATRDKLIARKISSSKIEFDAKFRAATQHLSSEGLITGIQGLVNNEFHRDNGRTVQEWIEQQPPGEITDAARRVLVNRHILEENFERAFDNASKIQDEQRRANVMSKVAAIWHQKDQPGARESLPEEFLPEL